MRIIIDNRDVDKEYALKYRYMGGVKGFKFLRNEIEELRKQISDVCPECGKLSYLKWVVEESYWMFRYCGNTWKPEEILNIKLSGFIISS